MPTLAIQPFFTELDRCEVNHMLTTGYPPPGSKKHRIRIHNTVGGAAVWLKKCTALLEVSDTSVATICGELRSYYGVISQSKISDNLHTLLTINVPQCPAV